MSKTRLAVLGLAALLLAGCGPVHPGAAAVVGDTRIPMSDVDDVASVYCAASKQQAQQGGAGSVDSAALRRQSLADLLVGEIADQIAQERDLTIEVPALTAEDKAQLEQMFGDQVDEAVKLVERNQRTSAIALELGREAAPAGTDEEQLVQAGQQLLAQQIAEFDVSVDPRFGLDETIQQVSESGSLSVPGGELDATAIEDRPQALQCT
ncbi:hypothetical protein H9L21_03350 [Aeromicrobium senzhongii]|uniref:SurA N-terminal domain-containing protein n=1 Tax=Aeromicrobium senzhongii TaxID=2663859 RepID=A0ABX6SUB8_9ACTN|nr:hypothetical protein [Aeromicrobium senzhongii]MTB87990.1 hypothetical protein [Aeromicrobium senzhongii]QNL94999.1 hypothetical protein H9L21_03350 [Aeromicrobium senzhongii]